MNILTHQRLSSNWPDNPQKNCHVTLMGPFAVYVISLSKLDNYLWSPYKSIYFSVCSLSTYMQLSIFLIFYLSIYDCLVLIYGYFIIYLSMVVISLSSYGLHFLYLPIYQLAVFSLPIYSCLHHLFFYLSTAIFVLSKSVPMCLLSASMSIH